jgi:hypothetical protein
MGRCVFIFALIGLSSTAFAFTPTIANNGASVRWPSGFKFNLAGNPRNANGLSETDVYGSVVHSLERWQMASNGAVRFDYWQGTAPATYEPNSSYNGQSSVYFASNANGPTGLTPNILGLTQVWYNTSSGQILEADTVLNDENFVFTENPSDTSGFGSGTPTGNHVFIENVLTHEFGHSLGLSHSGTLQATMLYMESPEQAHLGCDEQIAIHNLYPTGDAGARASIVGTVLTPSGSGLFGANVLAISRRRGTVLASAMSDAGGHYRIGSLEPGDYFIMAEPYFAGTTPLPAYYAGINPEICPGKEVFGRTLLADSSGYKPVDVLAPQGGVATAPGLTVGCNSGAAAVKAMPASGPELLDGFSESGFGTSDRFSGADQHSYRLSNIAGHLDVRAMGYSLYSPVRLRMSLVDSTGNVVTAQSLDPVYQGDSGYVNYDSALIADQLPLGNYEVVVSAEPLTTSLYPAGQISLDPTAFAVITGTVNEPDPVMGSSLPFNARCRMSETFASYQSPPGPPPRSEEQGSDNSTSGGCGMLDVRRDPRDGGSSTPPSTGGPGAVGWAIPWLMMGAIARLARRRARS